MRDTYELIGGYGAAKAVLLQPQGAIGFLHVDDVVRTVFLRAHDSHDELANGEAVINPAAYIAELNTYESIEELVRDSDATSGREHNDVLAWQIALDGVTPLCRYDSALTSEEDGNGAALVTAIASLPPGSGFIVGDYTSNFSDFILGWRTVDGILTSGCGPSVTPEAFSDREDMSDVPDDPHAEARAVQILDVSR
ncbi:hypothetical protein [uncultured Microbacterium sp.]|uniref:hypothetical protein n=1 Tax=uncultured Microbacterium sp. TaxID=191216 RepID=UPI002639F5A5|nr:hypothetical protein [uncultured Microbacterium sp.]